MQNKAANSLQGNYAGLAATSCGALLSTSFVNQAPYFKVAQPQIGRYFAELYGPIPAVSFYSRQPQRCLLYLTSYIKEFTLRPNHINFKLVFPDKHGNHTLQQKLKVKWCTECEMPSEDAKEMYGAYISRANSRMQESKYNIIDFNRVYDHDGSLIYKPVAFSLVDKLEKPVYVFRPADAACLAELFVSLRRLSDSYILKDPATRLSKAILCVRFCDGEPYLFQLQLRNNMLGVLRFYFINQKTEECSFALVSEVVPLYRTTNGRFIEKEFERLEIEQYYSVYTAAVSMHDFPSDQRINVFLPREAGRVLVMLSQQLLESYSADELRLMLPQQ